MKAAYTRKISHEEAREGTIMVLKDALDFFPPRGRPFALLRGEASREVRVEGRHCECRGPERPHEHYFIRWPGLRAGNRITIERPSADGGYRLSVAG